MNIFIAMGGDISVVTIMREGHLQLVLVGIARSARWPQMFILSYP